MNWDEFAHWGNIYLTGQRIIINPWATSLRAQVQPGEIGSQLPVAPPEGERRWMSLWLILKRS